ncbi:MAG: NFACT family protein [Thermoplasmata archaeon]|nr:NFACT family protein [Thermoplasmata archaeon]
MAVATTPAIKDRFTAIDTLAVVRELRAAGRLRVDKAFDLADGGLSLAFRVPGAGRKELVLQPGRYAALVPERPDHSEDLGTMAKELRRLLTGAVVTDVADPGGERALEIVLRRGDAPDPFTLVVELFGSGNLVVIRGTTIVAVLHPRAWAHRLLRVGAPYQRPPQRGNPWTATVGELAAQLGASRTDRISTLAARLALGGPLAEELLVRADLPGEVPAPTEADETARRFRGVMDELLAEVGESPRGYLYRRSGVANDVEPFRARRWHGLSEIEEVPFPTFSEAAHVFFRAPTPAPPPTPGENRVAELKRQQTRQEFAIGEFRAEVERLVSSADALFTHFAEVEAQRVAAEADVAASGPTFDLELEGKTIPVYRRKSVAESARELYDESKRVRSKLDGAVGALAETEHAIEAVARLAAPAIRPGKAGRPVEGPRRRFWFEKFRWFVSSEGFLVLGGRDAGSNEHLVRRYLHARDRYIHADVHGAPSVVVRAGEVATATPTEVTMREAGQFGVAFSKAWKVGLASATAYWVNADQVSKAAASGEFVPRGGFVIHGTRNPLGDLPTELGIGKTVHEGVELWAVAPPSAFAARGELRFRLTPGEERERGRTESELARELGVSRDLLQVLLPAGGLTLRRA